MIFLFLSLFQLWLWNGNQILPVQNGFSDEMKEIASTVTYCQGSGVASRPGMHGSGPMRVATPRCSTDYSLPASRRTVI